MVPAPLLAWVEPGRAQVQHPEVVTVPCSSCPWCDKGSSWWQSRCHVWVVRGKSEISWQDGSVIIAEEMGGK